MSVKKRMILVSLVFVCCVVSESVELRAQNSLWRPSPGHQQIPIWPGRGPDARLVTGLETLTTNTKNLVAGRTWAYVSNVSQPTITVYSPVGKNTGAAAVVFPGGGYRILAI